jgi:hypothetical protein
MPRSIAKVDPTDPAALGAWVDAAGEMLTRLHDLSTDATQRKGHRQRSRGALRIALRRQHQELHRHLFALDPRHQIGAPSPLADAAPPSSPT